MLRGRGMIYFPFFSERILKRLYEFDERRKRRAANKQKQQKNEFKRITKKVYVHKWLREIKFGHVFSTSQIDTPRKRLELTSGADDDSSVGTSSLKEVWLFLREVACEMNRTESLSQCHYRIAERWSLHGGGSFKLSGVKLRMTVVTRSRELDLLILIDGWGELHVVYLFHGKGRPPEG